jgi:integrase/recombinase XerD
MEVEVQLSNLVANLTKCLREKKYSEGHIKTYCCTWNLLGQYMAKLGISSYSREIGEDYLRERFGDTLYQNLKRHDKETDRYIHVLSDYQEKGSFLKQRSAFQAPVFTGVTGAPFNDFAEYLRSVKRNEKTIDYYKRYLNLLYLDLQQSGKSISNINVAYLIQFLTGIEKRERGVTYLIIATLRVFFKYLCGKKLLPDNREEYWNSILKARPLHQSKTPSVYSTVEVEKMIRTIDRGSPVGKRNYAMILLAARYGLRISDIVGLRFCNIDWKNNRIALIQTKTKRNVEFPLFEEVGSAIIAYLQFGRPDINEPYVFVSAIAPYNKLSIAVLRSTIGKSLVRAGIDTMGRKRGPHSLRHSLATNLLGFNEPLPVISEILGHSSTASTKLYLRVDFNQLKQCALEVPCVPSSFYENLYE